VGFPQINPQVLVGDPDLCSPLFRALFTGSGRCSGIGGVCSLIIGVTVVWGTMRGGVIRIMSATRQVMVVFGDVFVFLPLSMQDIIAPPHLIEPLVKIHSFILLLR